MRFLALFGSIVILLYCIGLGVGVMYIAWKSSDPNGLASILSPTAQTSMIFALELSGAFLVFVVGVYLGYLGVFLGSIGNEDQYQSQNILITGGMIGAQCLSGAGYVENDDYRVGGNALDWYTICGARIIVAYLSVLDVARLHFSGR